MFTDKNGVPIYNGVKVKFNGMIGEVHIGSRQTKNFELWNINGDSKRRLNHVPAAEMERYFGDSCEALVEFWNSNLIAGDFIGEGKPRRLSRVEQLELAAMVKAVCVHDHEHDDNQLYLIMWSREIVATDFVMDHTLSGRLFKILAAMKQAEVK